MMKEGIYIQVYGLFVVGFFLPISKVKFDENVLNNPRHNKNHSQGNRKVQFQRIKTIKGY